MHCYYEVFAAGRTLNNGKSDAEKRTGQDKRVRQRGGESMKWWRQEYDSKRDSKTHAETSLPAMAAILVVERADNLIVHIGDREGGLKGSSRRHGSDRELWWATAAAARW
jgi:hypothetical protein